VTRLLPPKREPWQLVLGPPGYFAIYSNLIGQYTQTDLTEEQAYATCRHEYGLTAAEAAAKVQAALDQPRLVYDLEPTLPVRRTTWLDLQRTHYQATPAVLKRMAIARRDQAIRALHTQTAELAREDWYAHVAKEGLTFVPTDRGWQAALRLATMCFGAVLAHDYVCLAICPSNAPGAWCLRTNQREGYVRQVDIERAFTDPSELHVFQIGEDTVVAKDPADAWALLTESTGTTPDDLPGEDWEQLPDDKPIRVACDDVPVEHGFPSNEGWTQRPERASSIWVSERTCGEWATLCGRSILGGPD